MTLPVITGLYAALIGIMIAGLTARVGIMRNKKGISLHDGGDKELGLAIRQQGNLVEQAPVALILIALVEMSGSSATIVHSLGGVLLVARIIHPFGLNWENGNTAARAIGAGGTTIVYLAAAVILLMNFLGFKQPTADPQPDEGQNVKDGDRRDGRPVALDGVRAAWAFGP